MRELNESQKKVLEDYIDSRIKGGLKHLFGHMDASELPTEVYDKVVALGDHETIHQNMTRHLNEIIMEKNL